MLTNKQFLACFRQMLLAREFDNEIYRLYRQGKIVGGAYPGIGNEATAVGSAFALEPRDVVFPLHRNLAVHFVRGQTAKQLFINHLARAGSQNRGVDGTGHYADAAKGIYGNISHLGAMIPVAAGVALAAKIKHEDAVVMTYIGDGGAQTGEFHEGVNFAAVQKLALVVVIENNQYAYSSPNSVEFAVKNLSIRAAGYGCFGETVDGTDIEKVYNACARAVARARSGKGPSLIECETMRMRGHAEHDDASYVPKKLLESWKSKDPLVVCENVILKKKAATRKAIAALKEEAAKEIRAAADEALAIPPVLPDPALLKVFAE